MIFIVFGFLDVYLKLFEGISIGSMFGSYNPTFMALLIRKDRFIIGTSILEGNYLGAQRNMDEGNFYIGDTNFRWHNIYYKSSYFPLIFEYEFTRNNYYITGLRGVASLWGINTSDIDITKFSDTLQYIDIFTSADKYLEMMYYVKTSFFKGLTLRVAASLDIIHYRGQNLDERLKKHIEIKEWSFEPNIKADCDIILMKIEGERRENKFIKKLFPEHLAYGLISGGTNMLLFYSDRDNKIEGISLPEGYLYSFSAGFVPSILGSYFISKSLSSGNKNDFSDYLTLGASNGLFTGLTSALTLGIITKSESAVFYIFAMPILGVSCGVLGGIIDYIFCGL